MIIRYMAFTGPMTLNDISLGLNAFFDWSKYSEQLMKTEIIECLAQHGIVIIAKAGCKTSNGSEFQERLFTSIKTAFSLHGESPWREGSCGGNSA